MYKVKIIQFNQYLPKTHQSIDEAIEAGIETKQEFMIENESYDVVAIHGKFSGTIKFPEISKKLIDSNRSKK